LPKASADWKLTPGRRSIAFSGLVPGASIAMAASLIEACCRLWPRPQE